MSFKYKLTLEYAGTNYHGWQREKNLKTIQLSLETAILKFCGEDLRATACGRTDAGVHAIRMPIHIETTKEYDPYKMQMALNFHLTAAGDDIAVLDITPVDNDFNARFSCVARHYVYKIFNRVVCSPIYKNRMLWVYQPLDVEKMNEAAKLLIGKHDFSTFRAARCQASSPIRTLTNIEVVKNGDHEIDFNLSAQSFLYHQVRNIVGSLLEVGTLKWDKDEFYKRFKDCDRTRGGPTAPAHGLYFVRGDY